DVAVASYHLENRAKAKLDFEKLLSEVMPGWDDPEQWWGMPSVAKKGDGPLLFVDVWGEAHYRKPSRR
ncbi:hypothetical protein B7Z17_02630, partial [Candidatus Saccharibacteria bacterium 32-49-10]